MDWLDEVLAGVEDPAADERFAAVLAEGRAASAAVAARVVDALAAKRAAKLEILAAEQAGKCTRCSGRGAIPGFWYVDGGRCFRCGGSGLEP